MTTPWKPKPQPIYQNTDTFQQLVDKLNLGRTQLDSDLAYLDSAFGPLSGSSFELPGLTTTAKSLVDAINELDAGIGDLSNLDTNAQGNLVAAVNEIEAVFDASGNRIDATGDFTIDAAGKITLDALDGKFLFKKNGANYARFIPSADNLKIETGLNNDDALRFTSSGAQFYGEVALPTTGTGSITSSEITANKVHEAIDQLNTRINTAIGGSGFIATSDINTISKFNDDILSTGGSEKLVDSSDIQTRIDDATAGLTSFDSDNIDTLEKLNGVVGTTLVNENGIDTKITNAINGQNLPPVSAIIKTTDINNLTKLNDVADTTLINSSTVDARISNAINGQDLFDSDNIDTLAKLNEVANTTLINSSTVDARISTAINDQDLFERTDIDNLTKLNDVTGLDIVSYSSDKKIQTSVQDAELFFSKGRIRMGGAVYPPNVTGGWRGQPQYSFYSDGNSGMYQDGANRIQFSINNAEIFRIDQNKCYVYKDLQIQNTEQILAHPSATLSAIAYSFRDDLNTGMYRNANHQIGWSCNGVREMYLTSSGLTVRRDITAFSDKRLKKEITPIANPLDVISGITGVKYTDIESGERCTGVIAQDVQKVLPEAVQENEEGMLSVAYGNMVGVLIEAVKELQAEVAELKGSR